VTSDKPERLYEARRGRPPKSLDRDVSYAARLGADVRAGRLERGLTQAQFGAQIGFSAQHVSQCELAKTQVSATFVERCDRALEANGAIMHLLSAVLDEQSARRDARRLARDGVTLQRVDPTTTRRGLLDAGAVAVLSSTVPTAAHHVDPELPAHWMHLLQILDRHVGAFGPQQTLRILHVEQRLIARHREVARGELRIRLLRVQARWAHFAAWLAGDALSGNRQARQAAACQALDLAREAGYPEVAAYVLQRRGLWAIEDGDVRQAITFTSHALSLHGTTPRMRALCALKAAQAHALAGHQRATSARLREADALLGSPHDHADELGDAVLHEVSAPYVAADAARCRLWLDPAVAMTAYHDVLQAWPSDRVRDRGVQQARLATACAAAGELDRAEAEGRKALIIARATKSATATRELKRLSTTLRSMTCPGTLRTV
jgi:transcriptional regulator with XRE-family HTH domain